MTESKPLTYRDAGVDIDAGNRLVDRIKGPVSTTMRPEVLAGLGGFGGLFQLDLERFRKPVLVSGADGVGTKLRLAWTYGRHDTLGVDLVAMCVNDVLVQGAEPLFFLDYFATGKLQVERAAEVIQGIAEGCRQAGCALIGGETAEMPDMYADGEYDLAGFCVGAVDRDQLIDGSRIGAGDTLIGLDSSGPHSNGYSLIRKVVERAGADLHEAFDGGTLGEALLAPTRIYVKPVLELIRRFEVRGLAHVTGGGLSENIIRIVPSQLGVHLDLSSWRRPEVFNWLARAGAIEEREMLRTFNCGIGMVLIATADQATDLVDAANDLGLGARVIGEVVAATDTQRFSAA